MEQPSLSVINGLTDVSRTYLPLVRASLDPAAEGVFIPSGRSIAFIANWVPDGLLLRRVPRRQVADLMPRIYRSEGEQLDLFECQSSGIDLPDPPLIGVMNPEGTVPCRKVG